MEQENDFKFKSREERVKHISKVTRRMAQEFYSNLEVMDMVDVFVSKSKAFLVGKIIEKHKKGFFVLLDGFGESAGENNVSSPFSLICRRCISASPTFSLCERTLRATRGPPTGC